MEQFDVVNIPIICYTLFIVYKRIILVKSGILEFLVVDFNLVLVETNRRNA